MGSPTYASDLAGLICDMLQTEKYGTYHAVSEGYCSRYDFARVILSGKDVNVLPIYSNEYGAPAKRPLNARLSTKNLAGNGFNLLPHWQNALERYLKTL